LLFLPFQKGKNLIENLKRDKKTHNKMVFLSKNLFFAHRQGSAQLLNTICMKWPLRLMRIILNA
jgi:hypothetical protein